MIDKEELKCLIFDCIKEYIESNAVYLYKESSEDLPFILIDESIHNNLTDYD